MQGYDCFIAHAGADSAAARELHTRLALHRTVFLALHRPDPGAWDETIAKAQHAARATVVLLSARSSESYYLLEEVAAAINLHRTCGHKVIPLLLEPLAGDQIPYGLLRLQRVTLGSSWDDTARDVERLLDAGTAPSSAARASFAYVGASGAPMHAAIGEGESATAGRAVSNTIVFADASVSTVHAKLWMQGGVLRVRDCRSKNGTYANGRLLTDEQVLATGDVLRLGRQGPEIRIAEGGLAPTLTAPTTGADL